MPVPLKLHNALLQTGQQSLPQLPPSPEPNLPTTSTTPTTPSPSTFTLFPLLPAEIRLRIWNDAIPARLLNLTCVIDRFPKSPKQPIHFHSWTPPPVLLSVCHESRQETLPKYVLITASCKRNEAKFYFNEWKDTIVLERPLYFWVDIVRALDHELEGTGRMVRSLAICNRIVVSSFWLMYPRFFREECEVRELFVVGDLKLGDESLRTVALSPVVQDCVANTTCLDHILQPSIEGGLEKLRPYFVGGKLPVITAVQKEFWETDGLDLVGRL